MATKRTKVDKAQRQADQLEKKSERRPEQEISKRKPSAGPLSPITNPAQETWDKNPLKTGYFCLDAVGKDSSIIAAFGRLADLVGCCAIHVVLTTSSH